MGASGLGQNWTAGERQLHGHPGQPQHPNVNPWVLSGTEGLGEEGDRSVSAENLLAADGPKPPFGHRRRPPAAMGACVSLYSRQAHSRQARQVSCPQGSRCLRFIPRQVCVLPGQTPVQAGCSTQPSGTQAPHPSRLCSPPTQAEADSGAQAGTSFRPGGGCTGHFCPNATSLHSGLLLTIPEAGAGISSVPRTGGPASSMWRP